MNRSLRSIFAMAMVGALPLTMLAQTKVDISTKATKAAPAPVKKRDYEPVVSTHPVVVPTTSKSAKTLAGEVKVLEKLRNAFSYYTDGSPFVYDEGTKAYFRVQRGPTEETKGNLYMMTSTDGGTTWSAPDKYYDANLEGQARYPSVLIHNKNKSANLADISYVFYATVLKPKGDPNATFDGAIMGFKMGDQSPDIFAYPSPENDNPDQQKWNTATSWATDQSKSASYMVQTLGSSATTQYGQYGVLGLSSATNDILVSKLPAQWGLSKFRPSTELNSSYNAAPLVGIDEEGTLYTILNNLFADNPELRLPSISKSTDGGVTWTELEKMPEAILTDYVVANGGVATSTAYPGTIAYDSKGFVVYGKDKYSFVTKIVIQDADANTPNPVHIVEYYHENGSWGIRKIADHSGSTPLILQDSSGIVVSGESAMDNEIQYIRTGDGNLLVKYTDFVTHNFAGEDRALPDVFYVYRPISSSVWGKPGNITNDAFFDKISWLPTSVPSIKDIPLIQMRTVSTNDPATMAYLQDQQHIDTEQEIIQRFFTPAPVGVEEEVNPAGLALRDAKPNPATNSVEIPFSVERSVETRIDLYTTLGEKVATVQSGMTAPGFHAVVLNTENLMSGTYYYTLTAGTAKQTKMLTIIR